MSKKKDVIIYIHGITPSPDPMLHKENFNSFENLLHNALDEKGKNYPAQRVEVEWGFNLPSISTKDKILADVERYLYQQVDEIADKHWDFTINPTRFIHNIIRKNFLLGFSDMFYYVSEDGKEQVRQNVFNTLLDNLPDLKDDEVFYFTIVSHSAGTVIMHDVLFILFGGSSDSYLKERSEIDKLEKVQRYAQNGQLFIKCFITLGSPITPMIVRSGKLLEIIHNNEKLSLDSIGIRKGPGGESSKWLNFWDKDDVISYPVEFLYKNPSSLLEDHYVDISDSFPDVHNAYWTSKKIAEIIAEKY